MEVNENKIKLYRCSVCKMRLLNHTISKINEHRLNHNQEALSEKTIKLEQKTSSFHRSRIKKNNPGKKFKKAFELSKRIESYSEGVDFYNSRSWMILRYQALKSYGRKCRACESVEGPFHVDHIKPRSKYPHLELELSNLQILCKLCNLGKSNWDETNWRTQQK
jgi:5-methylcytosine-specific restriction endonuclease McrA